MPVLREVVSWRESEYIVSTEIAKREAFEMIRDTDPRRYKILEDPLRLIDLELRNDPLPPLFKDGKVTQREIDLAERIFPDKKVG